MLATLYLHILNMIIAYWDMSWVTIKIYASYAHSNF